MDAEKIGKSIAFLRKYHGMTQRSLAEKLGVTDKAVSRWERGQGVPDISLLVKLSIILDIDIESILEGNLTHLKLKWKGFLELSYADRIHADTLMYDKCSVYFQISFFLLAGIEDIYIKGHERDIQFIQKSLGNGHSLGLTLHYEIINSKKDLEHSAKSMFFKNIRKTDGIMLIDGLDFLYGKDVTKYFRRIMSTCNSPVRLVDFKHNPTSIRFYPSFRFHTGDSDNKTENCILERGIIAFPIQDIADILDAANIIRILETKQNEQIADLREIAIRRSFIQNHSPTSL